MQKFKVIDGPEGYEDVAEWRQWEEGDAWWSVAEEDWVSIHPCHLYKLCIRPLQDTTPNELVRFWDSPGSIINAIDNNGKNWVCCTRGRNLWSESTTPFTPKQFEKYGGTYHELHVNHELTCRGIIESSDLPEEYKRRALDQFDGSQMGKPDFTLSGALTGMFNWFYSNEGDDFWYAVYRHALDGSPLPPLPEDDSGTERLEVGEGCLDGVLRAGNFRIDSWPARWNFLGFIYEHPNGAEIGPTHAIRIWTKNTQSPKPEWSHAKRRQFPIMLTPKYVLVEK